MTEIEKNQKPIVKDIEIKEKAPGVKSRSMSSITPENLEVTEDQVRKLAEEADSDIFANFIYRLYKFKPPKKTG